MKDLEANLCFGEASELYGQVTKRGTSWLLGAVSDWSYRHLIQYSDNKEFDWTVCYWKKARLYILKAFNKKSFSDIVGVNSTLAISYNSSLLVFCTSPLMSRWMWKIKVYLCFSPYISQYDVRNRCLIVNKLFIFTAYTHKFRGHISSSFYIYFLLTVILFNSSKR